jgi:hypothetical protein
MLFYFFSSSLTARPNKLGHEKLPGTNTLAYSVNLTKSRKFYNVDTKNRKKKRNTASSTSMFIHLLCSREGPDSNPVPRDCVG